MLVVCKKKMYKKTQIFLDRYIDFAIQTVKLLLNLKPRKHNSSIQCSVKYHVHTVK